MDNGPGLAVFMGFTGLFLVALYGIAVGWRYYRQGVMAEDWEHNWILDYVNLANLLLRRPQQERLTDRQIRMTGLAQIVVGIASLCLLGLVLVQAYAPKS